MQSLLSVLMPSTETVKAYKTMTTHEASLRNLWFDQSGSSHRRELRLATPWSAHQRVAADGDTRRYREFGKTTSSDRNLTLTNKLLLLRSQMHQMPWRRA